MKRKLLFLLCSVIGNALGTALMVNTDLGLTAWGSAAYNFGKFINVSFGTAFILLAIFFYLIAIILKKSLTFLDTFLSFLFLVSFGMLSDLFIYWIPSMVDIHLIFRLIINFIGLSILLLSIALHLKILIAVHPCDVFLYQMQLKTKSDLLGTYLTYGIAIILAIVFGLLTGNISGIGIGTIMTVSFSGLIINFFNRHLSSGLHTS